MGKSTNLTNDAPMESGGRIVKYLGYLHTPSLLRRAYPRAHHGQRHDGLFAIDFRRTVAAYTPVASAVPYTVIV